MKTYKYLFTLAMIGLLAASCQEDTAIDTNVRPAEVGEPIMFGASAAYENANPGQTRTEYSGDPKDGKEAIWWVPNTDKVQIYCAEASVSGFTGDAAHTSHYTVMGSKGNGAEHSNWLQKQSESSLAWGSQSNHTFYGVYPSSTMFVNEGQEESILNDEELSSFNFSGTTAYGYVHNEQHPASMTKTDNTYVAKADMRYAYMVAKTTTTREQAYTINPTTGQVNGVSLNFIPLATALEVTLHLPTSADASTEATAKPITISRVSVKGDGVAGSFSADLGNWDGLQAYNGAITPGSISRNEIVIRVNAKDTNGNEMPITLQPGDNLTFTVFVKPGTDLSQLQLGFASDLLGQNTKYKSLASAGLVALKKNVITNLRLPVNFTNVKVDYTKWMEQMKDDTPICGISLPGTSNSFSKGIANYETQTLSFDDQWEAGIRAFEIVTDRAANIQVNNTDPNVFGSLILQCGKNPVGEITVSETVDNLLDKLAKHPYETAMLIFTYQPDGRYINGAYRPERNGPQYMKQLMNYLNSLSPDKLVQFSPDLKLGTYANDQYKKNDSGEFITDDKGNRVLVDNPKSSDSNGQAGARGRLMIVVRPNQLDEKDHDAFPSGTTSANKNEEVWKAINAQITGTNANKILVINGCGTAKDKWCARGYTINGNRAYDISNEFSGNSIMETHMNRNNEADDVLEKSLLFTSTGTTYSTTPRSSLTAVSLYRVPQYDGTNLSIQATNLKFGYDTNNVDIICWFQEWQRVVGEPIYTFNEELRMPSWLGGGLIRAAYYESTWFESYQEKLSHVKATFDMAISGEYSDYVFINSLDGYLVMNNSDTEAKRYSTGSTYGGAYGDYDLLANKLNSEFYTYVNQRIKQAKAPTGIVLMNFVSNDASAGAAYYLPQLILSNNEFKVGVGDGNGDDDDDNGNTGDGDDIGGGDGNDEGEGGDSEWG
ncbi:MAG: hypothetical protein UH687_07255 [Bacteroidaceae bacterium]|nr:hypothetical protein [Bacteroidaceae bacterium]